MLGIIPVRVTLLVRSPTTVSWSVLPKVMSPFLELIVTSTGLISASISLMEIELSSAVENVSKSSSLTVWIAVGMVLTGASLPALTVILNVCSAEVSSPRPVSLSKTVTFAIPLAFWAGL